MPSAKPIYCAAVDLGATSGRVIVGTWANRRLALREVHRFPNALRSASGHDYWDLPGLWQEVQTGLRAAADSLPRGRKLAAVGVDTWGVDYVLVNDTGRLVFPPHAYRDARTRLGLNRLCHNRAALHRIYANTGIPAVFYNSSLQLAETVAACPAITELATRCLFLPDYFNFLLSGRMASGLAIAGTTQLLNIHRPQWSRVALNYFGVPPVWLSPPVATGKRLGRVCGLPGLEKTQVIAVPGHDTTCAYDAMPAAPDGADIFLSSGTWSLVGFESRTPLLGAGALAARVANDRTGRGHQRGGPARYRPLVNVIGLWLLEGTLKSFASAPTRDPELSALIAAAQTEPVSPRLLDLTDPVFANPPSMRAAIDAQLKQCRAKPPRTLAGYVRLICDSLGQGHAKAIQTLEQLSGRTFKRILMVGGGSKNRLLCQATADASGRPVISFALEGAAVGNLANQLISLGVVQDLATFRRHLATGLKQTVYQPRAG